MPVRTNSDHDIARSFGLDMRQIKMLEELQEGKQFSNAKCFPENTLYAKLAVDYSFFRGNLSKFCIHLGKIKAFIRISLEIVYIMCVLDKDLLSMIYTDGVLDIILPRFVLREELNIFKSSFYTYHDNRLRIFQEDVPQLFKKITVKASILCFTKEDISMTNQEASPQSPRLTELLKCNRESRERGLQQNLIVTIEIKLSKTQITFLIGTKGARIETLRERSGATIKIIPISEKMTKHERHHPDTVPQTLLISGDLYSVALAITSIESELTTLGM